MDSKQLFESTLSKHDYFLKINILTLNDLIEYQFILYRIIQINQEKSTEYIYKIANDFAEAQKRRLVFL